MFANWRSLSYLMVIGAGLLLGSATKVQAQQNGYAMVRITNQEGDRFRYEIKWGNGSWFAHSLEGNTYQHHWFPIDRNGNAPPVTIRFHTGEVNTYSTYNLSWNRVENTRSTDGAARHIARRVESGFWDVFRD